MSESKNKRAIKVGIFIFIGLAILALTVFTLGSQKKAFTKSISVSAIFEDVGGLQKGGNIWFSGVKVGIVKSIDFHGDSQVEVKMNIEKSAIPHIHTDAKAKISSDGLIGNKIIVLFGGTPTAPTIKENMVLASETVISTDDMLATLQENNKNILAITTDFKSISRKIDEGEGTIGALLNDPSIANKLNATATDLQVTLANLKQVSENSKRVMGNFQTFSKELNQPGNSLHEIVADTQMYKTLNKSLASVQNSLAEVQKATGSLNEFTANLSKMSEQLNKKDNAVGVLLNDPGTAATIRETMKNLETSSKKLDEDLEALQHNFLFRRYFKKKKKGKD